MLIYIGVVILLCNNMVRWLSNSLLHHWDNYSLHLSTFGVVIFMYTNRIIFKIRQGNYSKKLSVHNLSALVRKETTAVFNVPDEQKAGI